MELKKRKTQKELQVELAKYLIKFNNGQRLPSNRNLASATHMSMGSVSAALKELQDQGVVTIKNRGHLGSIVNDLSLGTLWNVVEQGPLVIALTLPMHCRFEGLATGLKMAFEKFGIETYLIYIRGSTTRIKALSQKRCHVAVMSGLAAEEHCRVEDEIIMELPQG
ncbi:MAG: GntR family transcriptional regulator, partial [Chloroflexi bacterium]|nr:GntR family transcriptional regulator [Chloroflexota bacterium]